MFQRELATRLGIIEKHLSNILNGKASITYEMAIGLENVIGTSVQFWMDLESGYQLDKARIQQHNELVADLEMLEDIPYNELSKLNWVESTRDKIEKVKNARKFYKAAKLSSIENSYAVAFRLNKSKNNI